MAPPKTIDDVAIKGVKVKERADKAGKKTEAKAYDPSVSLQKDNIVLITVEVGTGDEKRTFEIQGVVIDQPAPPPKDDEIPSTNPTRNNPRFIATRMTDVKTGEVTKLADDNPTRVSNPGLILREKDLKDFALGDKSKGVLKRALTQEDELDEFKNPFQEAFRKVMKLSMAVPGKQDSLRASLGELAPPALALGKLPGKSGRDPFS